MATLARKLNVDSATLTVFTLLIVGLLATSTVFSQFLSPRFLLQQVHVASVLGISVVGLFVVILLGRIDLSAPWTMTAAAVTATSITSGPFAGDMSLLVGLGIGAGIGLVNGVGVALLRIPSIIWTLAIDTIVRGIIVYRTAQSMPNSQPSDLITALGQGMVVGSLAWAVVVWVAISLLLSFALRRSVFGRFVYAVGSNEKAAYLSGVPTHAVVIGAFVLSGVCNALAGLMLAGYSGQAYLNMGSPYLLPAIAAVVIGGASILGGKGTYLGAFGGVLLITFLTSLLSVLQVPESLRQIIFGVIILGMVIAYSRKEGGRA